MNTTIKEADINLYEWIEGHIETLPHGELYYKLLDWKYAHQEVGKPVTRKHDSYTIKWFSKFDEKEYSKKFDSNHYFDPYRVAYDYFKISKEDPDMLVVELWHDANPYGSEAIRNGVLLDSFEREA